MEEPSQEVLEAASCWEPGDRVPRDAETTTFRRRVRLHQARWREAHGHPIGTQPINPRPGVVARPVGSRLPLDHARATGATFLSAAARDAAEGREASKEPHQTFDRQRLWAELLWSPTLAVNLFSEADDRVVHAWWPDVPGTVADVRFEHSPGRLDPAYLGNLSSFSAAVVLDDHDGTQAIIGVRVLYHDLAARERPKPGHLARYREVAERSGAFGPGGIDEIGHGRPTDLLEIWLDHLLVLSMLQHPSEAWSWGRLVLLHPAGHRQAADAAARYRELLRPEDTTFAPATLEDLLAPDALPEPTAVALRERYLTG